ncbi:MAG: hypothetical protein WDK96_02230 [Candidatus Paceibacterota bacterium]|jgi:malate/lactate dehydrogenase
MKWYFASRLYHKPKIVDITNFLTQKREVVLSDWIYEDSLAPYSKNISKVKSLTKRVVKSLLKTDIFVLISDSAGTDMFVELGVCLTKNDSVKKVKIYIVGEHGKRSLMQLHPSIIHAKNLREVFKKEKIDCKNFKVPEF